jgi:hypothetical protein
MPQHPTASCTLLSWQLVWPTACAVPPLLVLETETALGGLVPPLLLPLLVLLCQHRPAVLLLTTSLSLLLLSLLLSCHPASAAVKQGTATRLSHSRGDIRSTSFSNLWSLGSHW